MARVSAPLKAPAEVVHTTDVGVRTIEAQMPVEPAVTATVAWASVPKLAPEMVMRAAPPSPVVLLDTEDTVRGTFAVRLLEEAPKDGLTTRTV